MFKPISAPRGIANIFSIGMCEIGVVTENWQHRPDKENLGMRDELINNNLSNTSPISCKKGMVYKFSNVTFKSYFGGI